MRKFPESCRLVRGSIFPPIIDHLGAFRQKGVSQVERNGFLPLQRSVLFDTAECGKIKVAEREWYRGVVFYTFTSCFYLEVKVFYFVFDRKIL